MRRLDFGEIKILNLLGNGEQNAEERMVMGVGMFLLPPLQLLLPVQEGQLFITVIEGVMFFMVLPAEIITVKTALSNWSHIRKLWEQGIELIGNV